MREDFDELRIPSEIVERYPPDRFVLFDLLRSQVPDSLLKSIAQADYGNDVREHIEALKRVRSREGEDQRLDWHPREVLELVRWGAPAEWPAHDRHLATSFCACALIVIPWEASDEGFLEADSVGALLTAVPELDPELIVAVDQAARGAPRSQRTVGRRLSVRRVWMHLSPVSSRRRGLDAVGGVVRGH